ncbi:N-acetyltransferase family protein [Clostridium tepidum]|jgi:hypothetical protein|uniref:GNAT family N-acetyltransferase n=1 Tax=Clostridium tepidum TaxID=1962263 RepID=A0A1S9IHV2_9CLOT|nr:GNAT family N-acetyltransferase [Clostridium tepidum]MCR1934565.1 GNAT family N-acetyltransferase [Clostridium tepidum]MDU6877598.1 GNAT family N-acetyltransferase [Clostridium botulinum]OOO62555.1 GNAT family N-acetyltransferase [Clostridium tepidum]OOO69833.1 GNAT family N-acetyltransferase [Clostridium tepidum]
MEFIVREAKLSDLDDVLELWRELSIDQLGKDSYYKGSLEFNCGSKQIKESITNDNCGVFVAEYDNEIHGFVEVWINRNDFLLQHNDNAYILHYYINEEGRNVNNIYGIICKLYRAAEEWGISKGKSYIIADAFEHNQRILTFLKRMKLCNYKNRMVKEI